MNLSRSFSLCGGKHRRMCSLLPSHDTSTPLQSQVGSPLIAAAATTTGSAMFLLGCTYIPLFKMGIILCANTTLSLFFAMGFLAALLDLAGPTSTPVVVGQIVA
jgi:hypothetical protein